MPGSFICDGKYQQTRHMCAMMSWQMALLFHFCYLPSTLPLPLNLIANGILQSHAEKGY